MQSQQISGLIESIYEAAVVPVKWPATLQYIADAVGAAGGALIHRTAHGHSSVTFSPRIQDLGEAYIAAGWLEDPEQTRALYLEQYPGFRAESDYRTAEEVANLPVHSEFLDRHGLVAGVATIFQGAHDDILHVSMEGFASHDLALKAKPFLDLLRPHLGRAASLAAQMQQQRDDLLVSALASVGAGAAIVSREGRLRASNAPLTEQLGAHMDEVHGRLRFSNSFLDAQFRVALAAHGTPATGVASIGVRDPATGSAVVVHLVPIVREARNLAGSDGILLLTAQSNNISVPGSDLLRLLFDLTPSESALTRALVNGKSISEIAGLRRVSEATVRTQVKSIFLKTGVSRQVDLVRLLVGLDRPFAG